MKMQIVFAVTLAISSSVAIAGGGATTSGGSGVAEWEDLDANGDGVVTEAEAKALGATINFKATDKNGDDRLSKEEFSALETAPMNEGGRRKNDWPA